MATWDDRNTVLIRTPESYEWKESVIGFSLDGTLIRNKTGNPIPRNEKDWEFIYSNTLDKLVEISKFVSVVIIAHDKRIGAGKISKSTYRKRVDRIMDVFSHKGIECIVIVSTRMNCFSKPHTKLWKLLMSLYQRARRSPPVAKKSIYVGDMGGHLASKTGSIWDAQPKDSAYYDRAFAHNIGMRYWSPHVFFNMELYDSKLNPKDFSLRPSTAKKVLSDDDDDDDELSDSKPKILENAISKIIGPTVTPSSTRMASKLPSTVTPSSRTAKAAQTTKMPYRQWSYKEALSRDELDDFVLTHTAEETNPADIEVVLDKFASAHIMVIFIGPSGSGKSTLAAKLPNMIQNRNRKRGNILNTCFTVDPNELGSKRRCVKTVKEHIKGEADIIIDACNPSMFERREYIGLIGDGSYAVLIIKMEMADRLAHHMTCMRVETTDSFTMEETPLTSYVAYNKKYQDPTEDEIGDYGSDSDSDNENNEIAMIRFTPPLPSSHPAFWLIY